MPYNQTLMLVTFDEVDIIQKQFLGITVLPLHAQTSYECHAFRKQGKTYPHYRR